MSKQSGDEWPGQGGVRGECVRTVGISRLRCDEVRGLPLRRRLRLAARFAPAPAPSAHGQNRALFLFLTIFLLGDVLSWEALEASATLHLQSAAAAPGTTLHQGTSATRGATVRVRDKAAQVELKRGRRGWRLDCEAPIFILLW